jgi:entericidin B
LITQGDSLMMKKILTLLMAFGMLGSIAACQTIEGAGRDIQRGGEAIEDTAEETRRSM